MENGTKALIIAGSVLIGILVLSLISFSFQKIVDLARLDHEKTVVEQQTNYNALWEKYNGSIYGTDVMSMANQIIDYNKTQAEKDGYQPITADITINNPIETTSLDSSSIIKGYVSKTDIAIGKGTYSIDTFYNRIDSVRKGIDDMKKKSSCDIDGEQVKISKLSSMRRDAIISTYEIDDNKYQDISKEVDAYKEVLNLYQDIKDKRFTSTLEYDNTTGRIVKIIVVEK